VIIETIVTTVAADGAINCAPMGVEWDPDVDGDSIVLKPFLETATYRNVTATGAAVVNLIDDVRVFARAAISNPDYATEPATSEGSVVTRLNSQSPYGRSGSASRAIRSIIRTASTGYSPTAVSSESITASVPW